VAGAFYQLWFAVRYLHIASVTLLVGGASAALIASARRAGVASSAAVDAAAAYEWTFWSVVGVTVVTGVSNLGLKGDGLLPPETTWGAALSVKLAGALLLLAISVIRTDVVVRCKHAPDASPDRRRVALTCLYGLTVAVFLTALWIGLGLAHGRY
jgi:hypothetical protein